MQHTGYIAKYDNQIYGLAEAANYTDYMSGYKVFAGIETKMSINRDTLRKKQQELTNGAITSFETGKNIHNRRTVTVYTDMR